MTDERLIHELDLLLLTLASIEEHHYVITPHQTSRSLSLAN